MENNQKIEQSQQAAVKPAKRPDDTGSVAVEGFIKIFDPNSRKVFVEQQA
jgi:hypothetical protein